MPRLATKKKFYIIATLGFLDALTPFTIDLYLPAFQKIARDLQTDVQRLSLSISVYFVGFALGQIFYGPLLDRFGRKPPMYLGLLVYFLGSLGCMRAHSIEMLLLFRFVSALGGSAASVGAMSMVRDFFPPSYVPKVLSFMMLVLSASPLLAPSVGAILVTHLGWRSLFAVLCGFCLLDAALIAFVLPHEYEPDLTVKIRIAPMLKNFRHVLHNAQFATYTFAGSFAFAGLFVYVAGAPSVFMDFYKVSPSSFGAIFALLAGGMILGTQVNHFTGTRFSPSRIFHFGLRIQLIACALFFLMAISGALSFALTLSCLFAILLSAGIVYPNAAAIAIAPFTKNIGSASALLGFFQLGIGSLMAATVGLFHIRGPLPIATAMLASALIAKAILFFGSGRAFPVNQGPHTGPSSV